MEIRQAKSSDIAPMAAVYDSLFEYEKEHGTTTSWEQGVYPTIDTARNAFEKDMLYVLEDEGNVIAGVILNQDQETVYEEVDWQFEAAAEKVFVIHTMCVIPSYSGHGYASAIISFAEELGREKGCEVLRIDTWEGNKPAAALYTKAGYRYAGKRKTLFKGVLDEYLIFFEKKLS